MELEIWKDIDGFKGLYQVSNMGRIKSLKRQVFIKRKATQTFYYQNVPEKIREPFITPSGYCNIRLWDAGESKIFSVHRLVLITFEGFAADGKNHVLHLNHNKTDNRLTNLKWGTQSENMQMDWADGRRKPYAHWTGKFNEHNCKSKPIVQISLDGSFIKHWPNSLEAERVLGISARAIRKCCTGELRKTKGYKWKYAA